MSSAPALRTAGATIAGIVLVGCGSPGAPKLDQVVLKGSQVGPGYVLAQRPDGHQVTNYVTLDLCGFRFPSELLRAARLQVNYVHPAPADYVSNEVVTYRSTGAQQAMRELNYAASNCPTTPVSGPVADVGPVSYRLTRLTDGKLAPGSLAFEIKESGSINGRDQSATTFAVYQTHGSTLSAVYAAGPDPAAVQALVLHAAEQAAHNLGAR